MVDLAVRLRPRRHRLRRTLAEATQHLGAPLLVGDLAGDGLIEEPR
jgi:hypothetical protein